VDEIEAFKGILLRGALESLWLRKQRVGLYSNAVAPQIRNYSGRTSTFFRALVARGSLDYLQ